MPSFVTIVVPVYNVTSCLSAALDSVMRQSREGWKCICVDDGSRDGGADVLDAYAAKDERIQIVYQRNAGVSRARNTGICRAATEWIMFLDADDVLREQLLEVVYTEIQRNPNTDLVQFDYIKFKDGEAILWPEMDIQPGTLKDLTKSLCEAPILAPFFVCVYRRNRLPNHLFKPYCSGEDRLFLSEYLCQASGMVRSMYVGYAYRQRMGSAMNSPMTLRKLEHRIGYSLEWLICLSNSHKTIPRRIFRLIFNGLTESFIKDLYDLREEEQEQGWALWYYCLGRLMKFAHIQRLWTRSVIVSCLYSRSRTLARVLCMVPYRLKVMGLHR